MVSYEPTRAPRTLREGRVRGGVPMKVSYRSRLARLVLPKRFAAVTLGSHVYTPLPSLSAATLRHEQAHAEQWRRHGMLRFSWLYLWYHLRYGYERNPFEVEAREAE